jgi:hypothetical protein
MNRRWLVVAIFTFCIILAGVVFDTLHQRAKVEIPTNIQEDIEPISPDFNTNVLESSP